MSESRKHTDPALMAAVDAFKAQLQEAIAFMEDESDNPDQFYFEGTFRLAPIVDAIKVATQGEIALLRAQRDAYAEEIGRLRVSLSSIARNTCCDRCQEAAKVAQRALQP